MLCTADYVCYLSVGSDALQRNITFWSGKWSCFKVRVWVRALSVSSTIYASTEGWITFSWPPPPPGLKERKKVKGVIHDKLPSRNNVAECICYLSLEVLQFAECAILIVSSTTWHQWWVDNIFLTVRLQKRRRGEKKKKSYKQINRIGSQRCDPRQDRNKKWDDSIH